jgi:hypothetical protein
MNKDIISKNGFLKSHLNSIEVLSNNFPKYFHELCDNYKIPINKQSDIKTLISWDKILDKSYFFYDYENNEIEIANWLKSSPMRMSCYLTIEFGYNLPIIKVTTKEFINFWNDFVAASGFSGITCISDDGKYFLEFTDDSESLLFSNFTINPKQ